MQEGEKSVYDHEQRASRPVITKIPKPKTGFQLFSMKERQKITTAEPGWVCPVIYDLFI